MRIVVVASLFAVLSSVLGFLVGRSSSASVQAVQATDAVEPATAKRDEVITPRTRAPLVCAKTRGPSTDAPDCEAVELRARWCQGELDACTQQRRAVRQSWPEADTVEAPDRWTEAIDEALAQCSIGAELELVDCAEYPCTAALRPADTRMDAAQHEREMERLMTAVRSCEPLRKHFGVADENLDVYRLDARCPGGRQAFFALMALDATGDAYGRLSKPEPDAFEQRDLDRWMYRRGDDLVGLWPCDP